MVADRKGIGADDGARDGSEVVREEERGRCAAEAVLATGWSRAPARPW